MTFYKLYLGSMLAQFIHTHHTHTHSDTHTHTRSDTHTTHTTLTWTAILHKNQQKKMKTYSKSGRALVWRLRRDYFSLVFILFIFFRVSRSWWWATPTMHARNLLSFTPSFLRLRVCVLVCVSLCATMCVSHSVSLCVCVCVVHVTVCVTVCVKYRNPLKSLKHNITYSQLCCVVCV